MYDRFGHAGVGGATGGAGFDASVFQDFNDIFGEFFGFSDIFGGGSRSGRRTRAQRGADLREDITIEFEEAAFGTENTISYRRYELCDACKGSGSAQLPAIDTSLLARRRFWPVLAATGRTRRAQKFRR